MIEGTQNRLDEYIGVTTPRETQLDINVETEEVRAREDYKKLVEKNMKALIKDLKAGRTPEGYEEIEMETDTGGNPSLEKTILKHLGVDKNKSEESIVKFDIHLEESVETIEIKAIEFHFDEAIEELISRAQKIPEKQIKSLRKQLHENYTETPTGMESEAIINDVNYFIHEIMEEKSERLDVTMPSM